MNKIVFLVDDDPINNLIISKELNKRNNSLLIKVFETSQEALATLKGFSSPLELPGLILLDINMPNMNGWDFLDLFRDLDRKIPIFMITSSVVKYDREKAKEYPEIMDYLVKPLKEPDFQKIIQLVNS